MRVLLFTLLMLCISNSYAHYRHHENYNRYGYQNAHREIVRTGDYHKPGYFFMFNNNHYYPDYQEPRFFRYQNCPCYYLQHSCNVCKKTSHTDKYYYRFYNREGLSVEHYIR
jgi:hypothetical protein